MNPVFSRDKTFAATPATGQTSTLPPQSQAYGQPGQPAPYGGAGAPPMDASQLAAMYAAPSAGPIDMDRVTYEDVLVKTTGLLALVILAAAGSWVVTGRMPLLWTAGAFVGFVLAMVNIFRRKISPLLISLYALAMGFFIGGISRFWEAAVDGVVIQAVGATLAVFLATLGLFASGKVRASARATKIFLVALVGYVGFVLINAILVWTGVASGLGAYTAKIYGMPMALVIGAVVVLLGAYSFVLDFESIKLAVAQGAPRIVAWRAAFGLLVTIIWLYLELLRIIGAARSN